jgi:DNA-binding NtrC family response regulator
MSNKILCAEADQKALTELTAQLQKAGYAVQSALGRHAVERAVRQAKFDVVVLGHTLSRDDRHHLPYIAKKANDDCKVLVLHASGRHHAVDMAIDSRRGEQVILEAVAGLLALETAGAR